MPESLVIERRFRGPEGSGNGGYTCGLVASAAGFGVAEVTLRRPPPLDRRLVVVREDGRVSVRDGDALVAECVPTTVDVEPRGAVTLEEADRASEAYPGFRAHAFPTCFVCGPDRARGDGLRVFAGRTGHAEVAAAPWTPDESLADEDGVVRPEFVWAALDCPGAIAVGYPERGETVLGRFAVDVESRPRVGEPLVVVGWPLGEEGRKLYAGTALYDADGRLLARACATWIAPA